MHTNTKERGIQAGFTLSHTQHNNEAWSDVKLERKEPRNITFEELPDLDFQHCSY